MEKPRPPRLATRKFTLYLNALRSREHPFSMQISLGRPRREDVYRALEVLSRIGSGAFVYEGEGSPVHPAGRPPRFMFVDVVSSGKYMLVSVEEPTGRRWRFEALAEVKPDSNIGRILVRSRLPPDSIKALAENAAKALAEGLRHRELEAALLAEELRKFFTLLFKHAGTIAVLEALKELKELTNADVDRETIYHKEMYPVGLLLKNIKSPATVARLKRSLAEKLEAEKYGGKIYEIEEMYVPEGETEHIYRMLEELWRQGEVWVVDDKIYASNRALSELREHGVIVTTKTVEKPANIVPIKTVPEKIGIVGVEKRYGKPLVEIQAWLKTPQISVPANSLGAAMVADKLVANGAIVLLSPKYTVLSLGNREMYTAEAYTRLKHPVPLKMLYIKLGGKQYLAIPAAAGWIIVVPENNGYSMEVYGYVDKDVLNEIKAELDEAWEPIRQSLLRLKLLA